MINKILIANRGEIAVRIVKACRELDIPAVAVFSEVDRHSLHVQIADEAVLIGPPSPLESYLNIDAIINAAKKTNADCIHPGYGFLAENPHFAARCEEEGIVFIGPGSQAIELMGDKVASRKMMIEAGIPVIPGSNKKSDEAEPIIKEALRIGLPVLIKAAAGGGGKGMRIVTEEKTLKDSISSAIRESRSAFGDGSVFVEKYLQNPRHIEFQILADNTGKTIHLYERECSIQRRHQKIIEETPSVALNPELRVKMGQIAVKVAQTCGYVNAGTVEFLMDKERNFYFLEMNTRIQVEHPITEFTVGVDLVKWQIRIAAGEPLTLEQKDLQQRGHAIECRIYAEDPENNFLPSPGTIHFLREPSGRWIRTDSGIYSGYEVTPYYDPILSKLIVWGEDREAARKRMIDALNNYIILGIKSTTCFLARALEHPEFIAGNTDTHFIERLRSSLLADEDEKYVKEALIAAAIHSFQKTTGKKPEAKREEFSPWLNIGRWEIGSKK
jgi:acetyl-CoA carboxylase biotin carboxylase subunit